jgi:hypothetical protein
VQQHHHTSRHSTTECPCLYAVLPVYPLHVHREITLAVSTPLSNKGLAITLVSPGHVNHDQQCLTSVPNEIQLMALFSLLVHQLPREQQQYNTKHGPARQPTGKVPASGSKQDHHSTSKTADNGTTLRASGNPGPECQVSQHSRATAMPQSAQQCPPAHDKLLQQPQLMLGCGECWFPVSCACAHDHPYAQQDEQLPRHTSGCKWSKCCACGAPDSTCQVQQLQGRCCCCPLQTELGLVQWERPKQQNAQLTVGFPVADI